MAVRRGSTTQRASRLAKVQSRLRPVTESRPSRFLYMLIWGVIKSGKTTVVATGPRPVSFLAEPGHMTVRHDPNLIVFPINDAGDYVNPTWQDAVDFKYFLRYGEHEFKTVGIDSMSGLINLGMRFILKDEEARDEKRVPDTMTQPQWGRLNKLIMDYLEDLEAVCAEKGMHLILTAHERQPNDDDVELQGHVVPDMTPQLRRNILKRPAIIARTFVEEDEEDEEELRYGMMFRDAELMVGERVTPPNAEKPWLPKSAYDVTIPWLVKQINRKVTSGNKENPNQSQRKRRPRQS